MKPLILINFKNYKETLGQKGVALAKQLSKIKKKKYEIAVAPSLLTIKEVSKINLPVYAQHADPVTTGAHTGSISVMELKKMGIKGTLLNHSERKISFSVLKKTVQLCKQYKLTTVVCASSIVEIKKVKLH